MILTAAVFYLAHPSHVLRAAAAADLRWLAAAVASVLFDRTLMAMRWLDLLVALTPGSRPRFGSVLRIFFVSSFVSNFVPSIAADMYRAYALARHDVRLAESTASVLVDRMLGVLSMALVGAIALLAAPVAGLGRAVIVSLAAAFAACGAAGFVVFSERGAAAALRIARVVPSAPLQRIMSLLIDAVRRYAHHRTELMRVLVMSIAVQVIRIVQAWCLGQALGIELPLTTYFAIMPVILLIMQVPITVNGLGTTQVAFVTLFSASGIDAAPVTALSILFLVLGVVGTLPGGVIYAFAGAPARPGAQAS